MTRNRIAPLTHWQKVAVNAIGCGLLEYEVQLCLGKSVDIDKCKK